MILIKPNVLSDPEGRVHAVGHDVRHTTELDPGAHEERASSQGPGRGQVNIYINTETPDIASYININTETLNVAR